MICFAVTFEFDAKDTARAEELFRDLTRETRREPGNITYWAHRSKDNPQRYFLYEQYKDEAALEAHRNSPHFQKYAGDGLYRLVKKRSLEFFDPLF